MHQLKFIVDVLLEDQHLRILGSHQQRVVFAEPNAVPIIEPIGVHVDVLLHFILALSVVPLEDVDVVEEPHGKHLGVATPHRIIDIEAQLDGLEAFEFPLLLKPHVDEIPIARDQLCSIRAERPHVTVPAILALELLRDLEGVL